MPGQGGEEFPDHSPFLPGLQISRAGLGGGGRGTLTGSRIVETPTVGLTQGVESLMPDSMSSVKRSVGGAQSW